LLSILKSLLHNVGVTIMGISLAFVGTRFDALLDVKRFQSALTLIGGGLLLVAGFLLRTWAAFYFYKYQMKVIVLAPQRMLITSGPYRWSRNPLYLGGNVLIFFGAALLLGSPSALVITALHLPLVDLFIRREERQLQRTFGEQWLQYKQRVPRWI